MKRNSIINLAVLVPLIFVSISRAMQSHAQAPLFVPAPGSPVTVGKGSGEIVLADLNRDGHLDLLTKHLLEKSIAVRLGDGKGNFAPVAGGPMIFSFGPGAITLGDVNGDG
ncbi:MAG TPA: VCBS repeat-containing protein, partial [Blastocatellia bacterium]|nr:VCBS repeat-containing protein [Blastocatellia bacterium]